jgi:hypothetical protein
MHEDAAIILAGGEGRRFLSLTQRLTGDDRPKHFLCRVGRRDVAGADLPARAIAARERSTLDVVTA